MNVTLKLTMDGLIEALRWKALERQKDDGRPDSKQALQKTEQGESVSDDK